MAQELRAKEYNISVDRKLWQLELDIFGEGSDLESNVTNTARSSAQGERERKCREKNV